MHPALALLVVPCLLAGSPRASRARAAAPRGRPRCRRISRRRAERRHEGEREAPGGPGGPGLPAIGHPRGEGDGRGQRPDGHPASRANYRLPVDRRGRAGRLPGRPGASTGTATPTRTRGAWRRTPGCGSGRRARPGSNPGTFVYPGQAALVRQRHADGQRAALRRRRRRPRPNKPIYYHYGLDIGGAEGMVDVVAATDGLVVSAGGKALPGTGRPRSQPRGYDVVYLLDAAGLVLPLQPPAHDRPGRSSRARTVKMGQKLGVLGKEGGSGGWSHLHFDITARQPSGKWGIQEGYAFLWEAYLREHKPQLARRRPAAPPGRGRARRSSSTARGRGARRGKIDAIRVDLHRRRRPRPGRRVERTYEQAGRLQRGPEGHRRAGPGRLRLRRRARPRQGSPTDKLPPDDPRRATRPTFGIKPGDPVTFKVRTFRTTDGEETWDFGDGSPTVEVRSDGNARPLAKDGYAETVHRYDKAGPLPRPRRAGGTGGATAVARLHVRVGEGPDE